MCPDPQGEKKLQVLYLFHFNVLGAVYHCHIADRRRNKSCLFLAVGISVN